MKYKLYLTGGIIRDNLLGLKSKDYDYSVVIENRKDYKNPLQAFTKFENLIKQNGYEVFLSTPSCFTIRAKFPKGHKNEKLTADFVLARKEIGYIPNTRQPEVVLGTLEDDLVRRDFCVNTLAEDEEGNLIDIFDGQKDLINGILRTPTDTAVSFNNDPLRIIRAMRFMVTKGFAVSDNIIETIETFTPSKMSVVSTERIREELHKMFHFDTKRTMQILYWLNQINPELHSDIFSRDMWFLPTNKK